MPWTEYDAGEDISRWRGEAGLARRSMAMPEGKNDSIDGDVEGRWNLSNEVREKDARHVR